MADNDFEFDAEDQTDEDQDLDTDSQESEETEGTRSDDAPPASQDSSEAESKRIRDLTSKWQKAEARAAKAEKAAAARAKGESTQSNLAQADEFMDFAKEHARNTLYGSDPRLSKYGVSPEDITGDTPAEMRASLDRQRKVIDRLETAIRNEVMVEMGVDPDVTSSARNDSVDFTSMSSEDFVKFMERRDRLR